jgi:thiol-disulfide isomerase/thioredoxin
MFVVFRMERFTQPIVKFIMSPYGLLLAGVLLITLWFTTALKKQEGFAAGATASPGSYSFVMYYAPWCPHCKTAMPDWDALGTTQTIGGSTVKISKVDCDANPEEAKKNNVSGYPTFQLQDSQGALVREMGGEFPRDQGGYTSFLQSILS